MYGRNRESLSRQIILRIGVLLQTVLVKIKSFSIFLIACLSRQSLPSFHPFQPTPRLSKYRYSHPCRSAAPVLWWYIERRKDEEGTRSCKFAFRCIRDNVGAPILRAVRQERLKQHGPDPGQEPAAERLGGIKAYEKQFDCLKYIFCIFIERFRLEHSLGQPVQVVLRAGQKRRRKQEDLQVNVAGQQVVGRRGDTIFF